MKIAVGIIGIMIGLLVLLQSCAVTAGGNLTSDQELAGAGALGMFVGMLYFIGGAFAFGLPLVSAIIFVIGSLFAAIAASTIPDMKIWAFADLVLAAMAFFAWKSARKKLVATPEAASKDK